MALSASWPQVHSAGLSPPVTGLHCCAQWSPPPPSSRSVLLSQRVRYHCARGSNLDASLCNLLQTNQPRQPCPPHHRRHHLLPRSHTHHTQPPLYLRPTLHTCPARSHWCCSQHHHHQHSSSTSCTRSPVSEGFVGDPWLFIMLTLCHILHSVSHWPV
jgi:hypothetical protein